MNFSFTSPLVSAIAVLLAWLVSASPLAAQTTSSRPGSTSRTTGASSARTTTGTNRGTTSGGSSTGGPRQYRSNTELGDATIQIDSETRSIVIVTDEDTHRELSKVIQTLDKPKPQVLIKVVFLEVTYNNDSDVGVEGSYTFNVKNPAGAITGSKTTTTSQSGTIAGGTSQTTSTLTSPLGSAATLGQNVNLQSLYGISALTAGTFARVASDDWSATLHMLATKGKTEVLSRPSIMARNNQEAVIVVGQEVPFITNSRITDEGQTINTIQYDNVGIILRVTPFITSDRSVEMIVAPEISSLTDQTGPISNDAAAPVIAKRSAETVVVTPHAQTVVIGGLMETQRISTVQKIPILGDIPYLGFPFRRTVKSDVKKELLIFLTPYIVNDSRGLYKSTSDEMNRTELIEDSFSDNELQRYLDTMPTAERADPALLPTKKALPIKKTPDQKTNFVLPPPEAVKKKPTAPLSKGSN